MIKREILRRTLFSIKHCAGSPLSSEGHALREVPDV